MVDEKLSEISDELADYNDATARLYGAEIGTPKSIYALFSKLVNTLNAQTIAGVKTFSDFPITPSSAPTANYQVANRKFVLDNIGGGVSIQRNLTFSQALDFSNDQTYYNRGSQSGDITFSTGVNPVNSNVYVYTDFTADGSAINFPTSWKEVKNEYVADSSVYGLIVYWDGVNHQYQLYKIFTPDITAPTLTSGTVENATKSTLDLVFDEAVNITTSGWTINTDGSALSISSVSDSGTSTPSFNLSRDIAFGEIITLDYTSTTGDTEDLNGNPLATFTTFGVTNNVSAIINELNFTTYINNVTKTTPGVDIVYTCDNVSDWGDIVSDEFFDGDFEFIWELLGDYGIAGLQQSVGIDNDTNFESPSIWVLNLFVSELSAQPKIAGVNDGGSIGVGVGNKLKIKRTGTTVTVERDTGSGFILVHTFTGSYSQTGIRFKFRGFGGGSGQTQLYNPEYV